MINNYRYDCSYCPTKCDGRSKGVYIFKNDVEFSEYYENLLIDKINEQGFYAKKTDKDGYPDIEIYTPDKKHLCCYIEVKVQRRTFMSVTKLLPYSDLIPSETVALNLSDLQRYFDLSRVETAPIYILWVLAERPCILQSNETLLFYQKIDILEKIYNRYYYKRRFRRKSGSGDVVDNKHLGVVVNYHYSLNELHLFSLDDIL